MKKNKYLVVSAQVDTRNSSTRLITITIKAFCKLHARIRWRKNHKHLTYVGCLRILSDAK